MRWRRALRNRHTGGGCKTLIGAPGKSRGTERIRKGKKKNNCQLCVAELNESEELMKHDELRKRVLTEWQNKKKEVITHPYLKEKVEWGMVPYVQAMLLARYLRGDLDGCPVFLWK